MTALGALDPAELAPIAAMIRDAGISVLALPATNLYLMGLGDTRNVRRGLAPVRRLAEAGVNVAVSTNNVQNPLTPWGAADLLRLANLLATVAHLGTVEATRRRHPVTPLCDQGRRRVGREPRADGVRPPPFSVMPATSAPLRTPGGRG